jgi:hypothetical protein
VTLFVSHAQLQNFLMKLAPQIVHRVPKVTFHLWARTLVVLAVFASPAIGATLLPGFAIRVLLECSARVVSAVSLAFRVHLATF